MKSFAQIEGTEDFEYKRRVCQEKWRKLAIFTKPTDRAAAEEGVRCAYSGVGLPAPKEIIWGPSPKRGLELVRELLATGKRTCISRISDSTCRAVWEILAAHIGHLRLDEYQRGFSDWLQRVATIRWFLSRLLPRHSIPPHRDSYCGYGCHAGDWLAVFDFFLELFAFRSNACRGLHGILQIAQSAGWWWPFPDVCVVTDLPTASGPPKPSITGINWIVRYSDD